MKVLFVHGLNSSSNSTTGRYVKTFFEKNFQDVEFICPTFELFNVKETINKIRSYNFDIVIGHSFGGFYVLNTFKNTPIRRIVINPCFYPTYEIPRVNENMPEESIEDLTFLEKTLHDQEFESKENIFGIFAKDDELFSYYNEFKEIFGKNNCCYIEGGHRPSEEQVADGLNKAMNWKALGGSYDPLSFDIDELESIFDQEKKKESDYISKLKEQTQKLSESFKNVFTHEKDIKSEAYIEQYGEEVYKILVDGYRDIGGLKGVYSLDNLIEGSDFWKINTKNGKVLAVAIYTFKRGGRKLQCASAVKTPEGKRALYQIVEDDIRLEDRGVWLEASDKIAHLYLKYGASPIPIDIIKKIMDDKEFYDKDDPKLGKGELKNTVRSSHEPGYEDYYYVRNLGYKEGTNEPEYHEKIGIGHPPKR